MNGRAGFAGPRWRETGKAAFLLCATLAAYLPVLRSGFIWDDDSALTGNKLVAARDGLWRFWFTTQPADYWPVTYSTFWVEWRLWGMHALGYHAVNLALHVAGSLLLWRVLRRLGIPGSFLASVFFALHPVNVESVAWIAELKNLLALPFFLLAILFFPERGAPSGRPAWLGYGLSLGAFVLAILSKGSAVTLPLVLAGLVLWRGRSAGRDAALLAPYFALGALSAWVNVWFQQHHLQAAIRHATPLQRLLGAGAVAEFYLAKALVPLKLVFIYPGMAFHAADPRCWAPLLCAAALTTYLGCAAWRGRGAAGGDSPDAGLARPCLYGWGYFCVMLAPVMGFADVFFMKYSLVADHYEHLALIGVVALAGAAWSRIGGVRSLRPIPFAVAGALACLTWRQCLRYKDPATLYAATLEGNPDCWLARNNYGNLLRDEGRHSEAAAILKPAVAELESERERQSGQGGAEPFDPDFALVLTNYAFALAAGPGHEAEAIALCERALRFDPDYAEAHSELGLLLEDVPGRRDEAMRQIREALRINPNLAQAHYNLAGLYAKIPGREADAIAQFETALGSEPDSAASHNGLGIVLSRIPGRRSEAVAQYEEAIRLKPDYFEAHDNLALELARLPGRQSEAIAQYEETLRLNPAFASGHNNLANLLAAAPGRSGDSIAHYEAAVRLDPSNAAYHYNLANELFATGGFPRAAGEFAAAIRLKPDFMEAHYNLGNTLLRLGRKPEADLQFAEAARLQKGGP